VTELVQVDAEVMQWKKMFWLYRKDWGNSAIRAMEEGCDWPNSFKPPYMTDTFSATASLQHPYESMQSS
jgi:hypothetical protein